MTTPGSARRTLIAQAIMLLSHYGFDTKPHTTAERMGHWLEDYEADWIRTAIIEALYQGRYKAISVEHILSLWQKRGRPSPHFTGDFERIICRKLPEWYMTISTTESDAAVNEPVAQLPILPTAAATTPPAPAPVVTGVQRWRQLAQVGQPSADGEGMIARLRSFAYLDMTALPQPEAIAPSPVHPTTTPSPAITTESPAAETERPDSAESDRTPGAQDITPDPDLSPNPEANSETVEPDPTAAHLDDEAAQDDGAEVEELVVATELEESEDLAAVSELEEAEAVAASGELEAANSEPSLDRPHSVEPEQESMVTVLPVVADQGEVEVVEGCDRPDSPASNLLLLSQPQPVKPRPILDLPNPKRDSPTFRSGIRTFIPAVDFAPFLIRLLQFYATLPEPEAIEPMWASEPLPVSLERS